ncbi:hypothetical protein Q5P01_019439 [Channa striata]|uniref:Uncharacterized protein n=1 Tax=Channa striata TaxID=64152 RepID=A0AA88M111_CHASR|nr:hypothetical protein Q5P01_019439 [Channa striata]
MQIRGIRVFLKRYVDIQFHNQVAATLSGFNPSEWLPEKLPAVFRKVSMDILRKFIWLWVIIGMIFVSVMIGLIFILINKCISRRGKHRLSQIQKPSSFSVESNKYQERESSIPPLPPRTQFLTAEAQSYENLAEIPDYEQALPEYEENVNDYEQALPEYEENVNDYEQALPEYEENVNDYEQALPEYEGNVNDYEEALPEYEPNMNEQPDYVKIDDEKEIFPDPPGDNTSTEDYDDIGDEAENHEEDYDDVA